MQSSSRKITDHHNVPSSLGGSDKRINLSRIEKNRHNAFHEFATNHTPCTLTRLLAIHALGTDKVPHSDCLEEIFQITTLLNWPRLYISQSFRGVAEPGGLRHARKAAEYSLTHTLEEIVDLKKTKQAICNGGTFPVKNSLLLPKAQSFFRTQNFTDLLKALYSERDDDGCLAWVKPMLTETRKNILDVLHVSRSRKSQGSQKKIIRTLGRQEEKLQGHEQYWRNLLES